MVAQSAGAAGRGAAGGGAAGSGWTSGGLTGAGAATAAVSAGLGLVRRGARAALGAFFAPLAFVVGIVSMLPSSTGTPTGSGQHPSAHDSGDIFFRKRVEILVAEVQHVLQLLLGRFRGTRAAPRRR
ncbi:hypothetical protein FBR43_07185 [Sphingomonas baiyangensis]|uniref:Uncharacterized protein n=1 Tax=Sphingomonas baiyangensis TaxID=2572576 RepID=A0A4U1L1W4_9SPHN|nr:hypothetical protein FBR43_07185 [Sphingomonas baiyangensis]